MYQSVFKVSSLGVNSIGEDVEKEMENQIMEQFMRQMSFDFHPVVPELDMDRDPLDDREDVEKGVAALNVPVDAQEIQKGKESSFLLMQELIRKEIELDVRNRIEDIRIEGIGYADDE